MPDDEGRHPPTMQTTAFRACEACRLQKIRCQPAHDAPPLDPAHLPPISERPPCRRCRDLGRPCVYTEPRRTKRKRTDVRVRELEREVRQLGELLQLHQQHREGRRAGGRAGEGSGSGSDSRSVVAEETRATAWDPLDDSPVLSLGFSPGAAAAAAVPGPSRHPGPASPATSGSSPPSVPPVASLASQADPVAAGLLSMARAERLFRRYVLDMAPQRPFVVFPSVVGLDSILTPDGWTVDPDLDAKMAAVAAHVRANTPVLFLSILAAAVGTGVSDADVSSHNHPGDADSLADLDALGTALDALLLRMYAECIIVGGQKSVELIQALLVSSNWNLYHPRPGLAGPAAAPIPALGDRPPPPAKRNYYDHLRFYQHLHLAASMAIEIGPSLYADDRCPAAHAGDPLAFKRTLLACYICCSSVSLAFHRQTMFSFTPYIGDCLEALQTSPVATSSDQVLVAWVRLQRIVDMTASALGLRSFGSEPEPLAAAAATRRRTAHDLSDPGTQLNLQNATRQLEEWNKSVSGTCMNNSLLMQYHTLLGILHEASLYNEFDPADFRPPYRLALPPAPDPSQPGEPRPPPPPPLTPFHLSSRRTCLMAARNLLGIFLASPTDQLLGSPVVMYARIGYALVVLIKLQISAAMPTGAMHGLVLDTADDNSATQVRLYMASLIDRLQELHERHCRIASAWLSVVVAIDAWYETFFIPAAGGVPRPTMAATEAASASASASASALHPVFEPLRHCSIFGDDGQPSPPPPGPPGEAPPAASWRRPSPAIQSSWFVPVGRGNTAQRTERAAATNPTTENNGLATTRAGPSEAVFRTPGEDASRSSMPAGGTDDGERPSAEEMLDSILSTNDMTHWMDPRIELGDMHNCMLGMAFDRTPI